MKDLNEIAPDLDNAGLPLEDVATAGQPTKEHFERLAEAGYKTVIDLRKPEEPRDLAEDEAVRATGMHYMNIPVGHDTVDGETFERFRRILKDPENRPALVHCSSANRVGALLIPYLVLDEGKTTGGRRRSPPGWGSRARSWSGRRFTTFALSPGPAMRDVGENRGLQRALMGSVSDSVVRHAHCPVMIVRE